MAINYTILITGDCQNNSSGSISILPTNGTPPYTVLWLVPNLGIDTNIVSSPSVRTSLLAGTYSLTINDSTLPTNQQVSVNIPVSSGVCPYILNTNPTTCGLNNGSITGSSSSVYSSTDYSLYDGTGRFITSASTNTGSIVFGNLSAGTYHVGALDIGGCSGYSETAVIEDSTEFDYGIYIVPNSSCGGTSIGKLYVTGQTGVSPYTYLWSNGQITSSITGLTPGNYSVTVTDGSGCVLTKNATVYNVDPVGFGTVLVTQPSCFSSNGQLTMTITGGTPPYYYSASTSDILITYEKMFTLTGLSAGDVSIKVTDAAFCTFTETIQLLNPGGISSVSIQGINSSCSLNDGEVLVSVQGGETPYTYTLVYPSGNSDIVATTNTTYNFIGLTGGTYTVTIQDSSGCGYTDEVTILTDNLFTISTQVSGTTCGQSNGSVLITKSTGGTEPYDYIVDNTYQILNTIQSAVTFTNLTQGTHSVSIIDANGCTQSTNVYIPQSQPISYSLYSTSCGTGGEGTITAFISSGNPPFTFNWSGNISNNPQQISVSGLSAGTYSVTITDNDGCSLTRSTDVICTSSYVSYQIYAMGEEEFQLQTGTKCGLLQLLNEGFVDLTQGNSGCILNSASFTAKVSIQPSGAAYTSEFFTTTSLNVPPSDNLWYTTIKNLLLTIPGIQVVNIDTFSNQITIQTSVGGPLNNQIIIVDVLISYDITCKQ